MLDAKKFRDAMSEVASPVFLLATNGVAGRAGMTVTAVASVSDQPATILVCVNRQSPSASLYVANGVFSLNALAPEDRPLGDLFAGRGAPGDDRFAHGQWGIGATGAPVLESANAWFDCRLIEVKAVASHDVLIGEVVALGGGGGRDSLVYGRRAWRRSGEPI